MQMSDVIADMLTRIRNANDAKHATVDIPASNMKKAIAEGKIGKLHDFFYTTVGNGTAVASAKKFAAEYAQKLLRDGVHAVIMTST